MEYLVLQGAADQGYGNAMERDLWHSADNLLNGGIGADLMSEEPATMRISSMTSSDPAFETPSEGDDTVFSTAHYRTVGERRNVVLQGSADLQGYGNNQTNTIYGNTGNNLSTAPAAPMP